MQVISVYTISYGALVALLAAWRISRLISTRVRDHVISVIQKWIVYTNAVTRQSGSLSVNIATAICLVAFLVANILGAVLQVPSVADFADRLASLFLVNLVLVFAGGKSNLLADKVLQLQRSDYSLFHRWVGRICILEGVLHAILKVTLKTASATSDAIAVSIELPVSW
jgi:hypothetical protein